MKRKIVKWGSVVVALLFAMSTFSVSANMCHVPVWAAFHADGGAFQNQCDTAAEWIAGYYAAQAGDTSANSGSNSIADFNVVESPPDISKLFISRVDGTNPTIVLDAGNEGQYDETMGISGDTVHYSLAVAEDTGTMTIHFNGSSVKGRVGLPRNGVVPVKFSEK